MESAAGPSPASATPFAGLTTSDMSVSGSSRCRRRSIARCPMPIDSRFSSTSRRTRASAGLVGNSCWRRTRTCSTAPRSYDGLLARRSPPRRFYRVDRRDLSEEIPGDLSLSRQLRFCSQHVAHVHALLWLVPSPGMPTAADASEMNTTAACTTRPVRSRWTDTLDARLILPADGLHRNAAGDFFLMERGWWHRLRGYPELYTHAHIDAILCWVASSAGVVQEILPSRCRLYHQAHHRTSHADFPQTDWRPWYQRYEETLRQGPLQPGLADGREPSRLGIGKRGAA